MEKQNKYTLEVTEAQAQAIVTGLEAYMRIGLAQYGNAIDLAVPGKRLPGFKPELQQAFNTIKRIVHDLSPSSGYSILNKEEISEPVKIAHDIYEVMRHRLAWDRYPEGGSGVSFYEPSKVSNTEELPTFKMVDRKVT